MFRAVGVDGGTFNNFGGVAITNVYNKTVINDTTITRVSFNGGHRRMFCDVTATVRQKARLPVWVTSGGRKRCDERSGLAVTADVRETSSFFSSGP
ncbi:hypothetical protein, partial [Bradyrhizobium sp. 157]|uniref:hypothetical protein n=1 Tax=Bradyrhizobium sp. 157 TaxID=2782631 RepID=UPI001FF949B7